MAIRVYSHPEIDTIPLLIRLLIKKQPCSTTGAEQGAEIL